LFNVVLFEPEIPPNTGNIIRLCANSGCQLHLIEPLGFDMDDRLLRRAGLDYREFVDVNIHADLNTFLQKYEPTRVFAVSTKGLSNYDSYTYLPGDTFIFGPETRGLPDNVREQFEVIRIPMRAQSRSLNLANASAIVVYEALRQTGFSSIR